MCEIKEGWNQWLQRLVLIINEHRLSTANPDNVSLIEQHMLGFLFKEGDLGNIPAGFAPKKKIDCANMILACQKLV